MSTTPLSVAVIGAGMAGVKISHTLAKRGVKFVVLEMGPVLSMDSTAVHAFKEILEEYKSRGITLVISNPSSKVRAYPFGVSINLTAPVGYQTIFSEGSS